MKIVINTCFGGFGLSSEAVVRYGELKGFKVYPEADPRFGGSVTTYWTVPPAERAAPMTGAGWWLMTKDERVEYNRRWGAQTLDDGDIARSDPHLVQVVQELGDRANGKHAELKIVEVPDGVSWEIDEYDGVEHIAETHRTWG